MAVIRLRLRLDSRSAARAKDIHLDADFPIAGLHH
jgi:hypothetical protein